MNGFLAEMYGTRESIGAAPDTSDIEKAAEVQLLDNALRSEGVDIDTLDGGTVVKLAAQIFGEGSALVKAAEEAAKHEEGETSAEENEEEGKEGGEEAVRKAALAELGARGGNQSAAPSEETFEEKVAQADYLGRVMAHSYWQEKTTIEKQAATPGSAPTGKNKSASAVDVLAEKRAMEWAEAHGLLANTQANPSNEEKLAAAVDQRAVEMLTAAGVDVAAVEASRAG